MDKIAIAPWYKSLLSTIGEYHDDECIGEKEKNEFIRFVNHKMECSGDEAAMGLRYDSRK